MSQATQRAFVVEHLDPELGPWSALEYGCIARESHARGARFLLSSVPAELQMPADLAATNGLEVEQRSVEDIFAEKKDRVCLLDPAASVELSPEDGDNFDVFLFGGILGMTSTSTLTLTLTPAYWFWLQGFALSLSLAGNRQESSIEFGPG